MSNELVDLNYMPMQSSSAAIVGNPFKLYFNINSVCFQFEFEGSVQGTAYIEATIIPDLWETLQGCCPIVFDVPGKDLSNPIKHQIVTVPDTARWASYLRLRWEPSAGSSGNFRVAYRILPV